MTRHEFEQLIEICDHQKLIVPEKQLRYALALWSYGRDDEARNQLNEARQEIRKHLNL